MSALYKLETGYVDIAIGADFSTTGTVTLLNEIEQGYEVVQRVGKKVKLISLQMRGHIYNLATSTYNKCVWLVIYDRKPTGSLPLISDVLTPANANGMNNDVNTDRFTVLHRSCSELVGAPAALNGPPNSALAVEEFIDLKKRKTVFDLGTDGGINDIVYGALYFVTIGTRSNAGTNHAEGEFYCRTRFIDNVDGS